MKIKIIVHFVPTRPVIEYSKKIAKNLKKLKNTVTASFEAKTGWKRLRKGENKNYRSIFSYPTRKNKLQKNSKKIQKIQ